MRRGAGRRAFGLSMLVGLGSVAPGCGPSPLTPPTSESAASCARRALVRLGFRAEVSTAVPSGYVVTVPDAERHGAEAALHALGLPEPASAGPRWVQGPGEMRHAARQRAATRVEASLAARPGVVHARVIVGERGAAVELVGAPDGPAPRFDPAEVAAFVGAALDVPASTVVLRSEPLTLVRVSATRAQAELPVVVTLSALVLMLSFALIHTRRAVRKRVEEAP